MRVLEGLEPQKVFFYFEEIAKIPHGSRNTKAISDYIVDFAKNHNLKYIQDELNNVILFADGTEGYENSEPLILQGHMDMVCEKENGVDIDFEKDGLSLLVKDGYVTADGTTLGGDDGIAVAYALAILDSDDIPHPPLEIVLTVDEEIGMLGAYDIDLSMLKGKKMLNLDSDVEGEFLTGCAGGMSLISRIPVEYVTQTGLAATLTVSGLQGGHSGAEIHKERGNADILMGRVLKAVFDETPFGIASMAGGLKDNAIARECKADILIPEESRNLVSDIVTGLDKAFKNEFMVSDPDVYVSVTFADVKEEKILDFSSVNKIIYFLRVTPNGVQNKSQVMDDLVETSLNLGILELQKECLMTVTSIRSSVSTRKEELKERLCQIVEMLGGEAEVEGDYPAWEYKPQSKVRELIGEIYREMFGKEASFAAIHAGLECGIFSEKIAGLDCVSFGPENYDIHTPKERLSIASTERMWKLILEFFKRSK